MSLEKPRCSTCKNFVATTGRCELPPQVFVKFATKAEDVDRTVTAWREVKAGDGCNEHQDFVLWKSQVVVKKFIDPFGNEDMINLRGPFNCKCVQLNKAKDRYHTDHVHNGRHLSADNSCKLCRGAGIVDPNAEIEETEEYFDETRQAWMTKSSQSPVLSH